MDLNIQLSHKFNRECKNIYIENYKTLKKDLKNIPENATVYNAKKLWELILWKLVILLKWCKTPWNYSQVLNIFQINRQKTYKFPNVSSRQKQNKPKKKSLVPWCPVSHRISWCYHIDIQGNRTQSTYKPVQTYPHMIFSKQVPKTHPGSKRDSLFNRMFCILDIHV